MPTRDEWNAILEHELPPQSTYIARNRAITACYAGWYLQEPWLFKWAGMAAFASFQVGVGLAMVELLLAPHKAVRVEEALANGQSGANNEMAAQVFKLMLSLPLALHDAATRPLLLADLELVKQANDAIFNDIGWAHLAYLYGGLDTVEANLTASDQSGLREAFRMLDAAVHLLCKPQEYQAGLTLINQAAVTMLRHEQMTVLPRYMEKMSDLGRRIASLGSWLDFEGGTTLESQASFTFYYGPLAVLTGTRSVTNAADRWQWIEQDVLPKWAKVNAKYDEGTPMHARLVSLAHETPTMLQQTAGLMNRFYPALTFQASSPVT
ncbi:hypothetical protein [Candidatus Chloroploca sp. Khr17]|uniref:DUF2515 family protein n=1 Tax=Candidatus Chloroploca sp. Khr17 TaxID=2496869 RepID=UPI00101C1DE8|nr:hypothetical protein [Candidatus Chloroploca sp. Khr17]